MAYQIPDEELAKLEGMNEPMRTQLINMLIAAGGRLHVSSGVRSNQRQQELWADALRRYGDPEVADNWVARPGTSNHEHGWAVDLSGDLDWAHDNAAAFGMHFPLSNENWHMEFAGEHTPGAAPAGGQGGQGANGTWNGGVMFDLDYTNPAAAQNPQDVLANRLHSVLNIIGLDPAMAGPGVTVMDENSPAMNVLDMGGGEYQAPGGDIPEQAARFAPAPEQMGGIIEGAMQGQGQQPGAAPLSAGGAQDPNGYGAYAQSRFGEYGWSDADYAALVALWNEESGTGESDTHVVAWNPNADNPTSTAYGIAQFLDSTWAGVGASRTSDPQAQIDAGMKYIAQRYGNPRNALDFHHRNNWY